LKLPFLVFSLSCNLIFTTQTLDSFSPFKRRLLWL
jgi:hypothetical protein